MSGKNVKIAGFERGVYVREDIPRFNDAFAGPWEPVRVEPEESIEAAGREALAATGLSV